jgi:hypothetical protein
MTKPTLCRENEPDDPVPRLGYSLRWRGILDFEVTFRYHDPQIDVGSLKVEAPGTAGVISYAPSLPWW